MKQDEKGNHPKVGWLCSYTPVEILMAGGLVPSRLNVGEGLLQKPNPNIYQLICPYIRSVFDAGQHEAFDSLEGVVFMKCCDGMLRLYDLWKAHMPGQKSYILPLPKVQTPEATEYFSEAMRRFAGEITNDMGTTITEDTLHQAIHDANQFRSAVERLYQWRYKYPMAMSYSGLQTCIREWLAHDPKHVLLDVKNALKTLEGKAAGGKPESKVLLSSSTLDQIEIMKMIEEAGMTIVADDVCIGLRHFDSMVSEDGDPFLSLAERYLNRWPCSRMQAEPSHIQRQIQEVEDANADGVIYVGLKYCDQAGYDMPRLQSWFKDRQIPFLYIENDYTASGMGQLKVRIEAFAEILNEEF
jgi:benzoyl-CoA reductase/2-hydroxyglutaryl-CoA dehydratase subunit BcrC/BadD/HgdB